MADLDSPLYRQLSDNRPNDQISDDQVLNLYRFITAQPSSHDLLHSLVNPERAFDRSITIQSGAPRSARTSSAPVIGGLVDGWIYANIDLDGKKEFPRKFSGTAWGFLPGIPAGALIGTLNFNNMNDFEGDCSFVIGGVLQYLNITFFKGGNQIGTYHAGNVGGTLGLVYGSGKWTKT